MHHGNKYEQLSIQFYEKMYKTKVGEYGCLRHEDHCEIGASPDGINEKYSNNRYGYLLEIKNIVNRPITGIPLKKYWIQMQLQMEVTKLDYCDFLETRFKEFENKEDFDKGEIFNYTEDGKLKGAFIHFQGNTGPIYKFPPFQCNKEVFNNWFDQCLEENKQLSWVRTIYWWLEEYSCVLVQRNKEWFKAVLPDFKTIWGTIEKERLTGYDHRKPKKRKQSLPKKDIVLKVKTESFLNSQINEEKLEL